MPHYTFDGPIPCLHGWRKNLRNVFAKTPPQGDIYQFGVAGGYSMQHLGYLIRMTFPSYAPTFYGFDVFTGMPVESYEPDKQLDTPGSFKLVDLYGVPYLNEALRMLKADIQSNLPQGSKLAIVPGMVEDTLKGLSQLKPAFYVDMDMDIYGPTRYALDFMFRNKLIISGTIIGFDDWGQNYPEFPTFSCGESRALKEVIHKYDASYETLYTAPDNGQVAIQIKSL